MDLYVKVVSFLKKRYPHSLFTVTLGENQDTVHKRIDSFKKGYLRGSPDLIINYLHKHYTGFCIEFKSPKGNGILSSDQSMILLQYQNNGFKTLKVICCYDDKYSKYIAFIEVKTLSTDLWKRCLKRSNTAKLSLRSILTNHWL